MRLRCIDFGNVFCSSGARNFDGDGWWYHSFWKPFGLDYTGSTLIAKTTTLEPREGNMPLKGIKPREFFPSCVKVNFLEGAALNAVGLSGPGAQALLDRGVWDFQPNPYLLSFMAVGKTPSERLEEVLSSA